MPDLDPGVELTELTNGLRIVTETMPEARSVTLGAWVAVGGRDEPDPLSGTSHFLEHLLFKGTEERSARDIAQAIDAVGGEMNAFTASEHTAYYARLPHQQMALGAQVLGEVLTVPALRPAEVEAERQVILEEILMNLDSPEDRVHTLLSQAVFPDHPLGREVLGEKDTIVGIGRADIAQFFEGWYRPANMVVAAAGRLDHAELVDAVAGQMAGLSGGQRPHREPPTGAVAAVEVEGDDTEQAHLALGWRSLPADDDRRWALSVGNQVLGGGMASRLFQEIREERGLAYSVYSHATAYTDCGFLTVYCGTGAPRAPEALAVIDQTIASLLADGITDTELQVATGYLEGSMLLGLEDSGGRMGRLGRGLMQRDEIVTIDEHLARLRAVTAADVMDVLHQVLDGPRALAAVGPFDAAHLLQ